MTDDGIPDVICAKCGGVVNVANRTCVCWERDIDLMGALVQSFIEDGAVMSTAAQIADLPRLDLINALVALRGKVIYGKDFRY